MKISFTHPQIDAWYNETGEATSTFDVCEECFNSYETAGDFGLTNSGYNGDPIPADATAEDTGYDPDYAMVDYTCECCGKKLV